MPMIIEVKTMLTMALAQKIVERAKSSRVLHAHKMGRGANGLPCVSFLEEDALLGQCVRVAEDARAHFALLIGGVVTLVLQRVFREVGGSDWVVWPEIITHTQLRDDAMGEAGGGEIAAEYSGRRTVEVGQATACFQSSHGLLPVLVGLGELAKVANSKLCFKLPGEVQGQDVVQGAPSSSSTTPASDTAPPSFSAPGKSAKSSSSDTRERSGAPRGRDEAQASSALDSFVLAREPLFVSHHSELWRTWPVHDDNPNPLIFKKALQPEGAGAKGMSHASLDAELKTYTRASGLQGRFIPNIVSVIHHEEDSTTPRLTSLTLDAPDSITSSQSASPVEDLSFSSASSSSSVAGLILTDVGCSLHLLGDLSAGDGRAIHARARLPTDFVAAMASYLVHARCVTLAAASVHIAALVDAAVAALHGADILHGDIAARNICLRMATAELSSSLVASLIDLEDSTVISAIASPQEQEQLRGHFGAEREEARSATYAALSRFWPVLVSQLTILGAIPSA